MYYVKESFFLYLYSITMSFLSVAGAILDISSVLKYLIFFASIIFFCVMMMADMYSVGKKACEQRYVNDVNRKRIIETGENILLKEKEEFKPYKGFLMGAIICVPMILFLFIHFLIHILGGQTLVFGQITNIMYYLFSAPILEMSGKFEYSTFFYMLFGILICSVFCGVGYIIGGYKHSKSLKVIDERDKEIYGEKD